MDRNIDLRLVSLVALTLLSTIEQSQAAVINYLDANSNPHAYQSATTVSVQVPNNVSVVTIANVPSTVFGIRAYNNSSVVAYGKLYDNVSSSVTCGVGTPHDRFMIPGNATGTGFVWATMLGAGYTKGVQLCVTTGFADSDTSAPAASTYILDFDYRP